MSSIRPKSAESEDKPMTEQEKIEMAQDIAEMEPAELINAYAYYLLESRNSHNSSDEKEWCFAVSRMISIEMANRMDK